MSLNGRWLPGRHRLGLDSALPAVEAASQPEQTQAMPAVSVIPAPTADSLTEGQLQTLADAIGIPPTQDGTADLLDQVNELAAKLDDELDATTARLHAVELEYTRFVAAVLHNAPQEWGDITPATALRYLRHLEIEVGRLGGRDLPSRCYPPVAETTPIGDAAASALAAAKAASQTARPPAADGAESPQALAVVPKLAAAGGRAEDASPAANGEGDGGSAPVAAAPGKPAKAAGLAPDSGAAAEGAAAPEPADGNDCAEGSDER